MNEINRILKAGIISEEFLREETICDYLVTEKAKKVWAVCLDLLVKLDEVCKKHGLKYFLGYGTLLGAARHKGFIPWDDDVDVFMLRDDYEKLYQLSNEFVAPYFLQTPETDKGYLNSIIKIRNANTTNFSTYWGHWGWNGGIWIDVFPLDKCILEDRKEVFQEVDKLNSYNSAYMKIPGPYLNEKGKRLLLNNLDLSPKQALRRITELATKYRESAAPYVTECTYTNIPYERKIWDIKAFQDTVNMEFCGRLFPVPVGWEFVLEKLYGDWRKFPPVEERGCWHQGLITDPDRPYTTVFEDLGIKRP